VQRQIELLEDLWQSGTGNPPVRPKQRPDALHARKEEANHRYFRPDLLPVVIEQSFLDEIRSTCRSCR
jgi:aspartyl-tRNA(Asn)/glutamyl-tRNA(Gln) amidotransferase subunit B